MPELCNRIHLVRIPKFAQSQKSKFTNALQERIDFCELALIVLYLLVFRDGLRSNRLGMSPSIRKLHNERRVRQSPFSSVHSGWLLANVFLWVETGVEGAGGARSGWCLRLW